MSRLQKLIDEAWIRHGTMQRLADSIGVPKRTIEDWLSGSRRPTVWAVETLEKRFAESYPKGAPKRPHRKKAK